jgi:hypothetical protein
MDLNQLKSEQLDAYLASLTPKAAEFLIREVERDRLKGGNAFPHDLVLRKAREVVKKANQDCARFASPQRVFCHPFEGLLVDRTTEQKQLGRITRSSSDAIWKWLLTEIASDALPQLAARITDAALSTNDAQIQDLSRQLYGLCHERLSAILDTVEPETKAYGRIAAQLGGQNAVRDAYEIRDCMKCAPALLAHLARAPATIRDLQDDDVELYARWYSEFEAQHRNDARLLLVSLHARCPRPVDMLKILVCIVGSNEAEIAHRHIAGNVVEIMLHDMEIAAQTARENIVASTDLGIIKAHLSEFHASASAICDALELDLRGAWGNRLVAMRSTLSATLRERISAAPRLIKAALFQKIGKRAAHTPAASGPDPQRIKDAEFAVNLLVELRAFLGQLTLNADYSRVKSEVEQFLEVIAERLLRDIQDGADDVRAFAEEGYPSAGRLLEALFGKEASELYLRRARAAMQHAAKSASA